MDQVQIFLFKVPSFDKIYYFYCAMPFVTSKKRENNHDHEYQHCIKSQLYSEHTFRSSGFGPHKQENNIHWQ